MHYRILARTIGTLLFIEAAMILACLGMSLYYKECDSHAFLISLIITVAVSTMLRIVGRHSGNRLNRRESYFIVATTWIVFSLIGMLPFLIGGYCSSFTDAFFETMSGFTTTGTSLMHHLDTMPHAILFWRSLTQWVGGLGIVFFTLAFLPTGNGNENGVRLFSAEVTGITHEKLHPRISTTVKWLFSLYALLTLLCAAALWLCGIGVFDSINHAMTTTATGGFSTHDLSIQYFRSPAVEYVISGFMLLSGISFYMLYMMFQRHTIRPLRDNGECRFYLTSVLLITLTAAVSLILYSGYDVEHAVRSALFNVVSLHTSTGFVSENFALWWRPLWFLLFFAMITGGCAGSTSGGVKSIRMLTLMKTSTNQFQHILHPNLVRPVRINGRTITEQIEHALLAFVFWYLVLLFLGTMSLSLMNMDFLDSINLVLSCLSNVGICDGTIVSPMSHLQALPAAGKWICSFLMLAGRLEIFPILLPLAPSFWKGN